MKEGFINYNLTSLYLVEPVNTTRVYSDSFQQFLEIKNTASHLYKLTLPDGNYNIYHYNNGICSQVDVHSTFFTIQMKLVN